MKILFVGQMGIGTTTQMRHDVLVKLGHDVRALNSFDGWSDMSWVTRWINKRLGLGSVINILNKNILKIAEEFKPDLFWGEKQEYIRSKTL